MSRGILICCVTVALDAAAVGTVTAGEQRMALVVGNSLGDAGDVPLRFAHRDAKRMAQALDELGGIQRDDLLLLLDEDADAVRAAFAKLQSTLVGKREPSVILFFYSGHADERGLHLGSSIISWAELRRLLEESAADLRLAMVDACQSGSLTIAKGLSLAPAIEKDPRTRGTAFIVAAQANESAQESLSLGGSFFTHYLVSGLRGAADDNHDGLVTLAEAHSYTTSHTRQATSHWARAVQRPAYEFNISGHGEIVLTNLRESAALLRFEESLEGHIVVTERGSPLVLLEADKSRGRKLELAVPIGRYLIALRESSAVFLSEVTLPWGGDVEVRREDMERHSYQSVAQKGGVLSIHHHRIRLGGGVQTSMVQGMGVVGVVRAGYGIRLGPLEVGARLSMTRKTFAAVDTTIRTEVFGFGLELTYEYPLRLVDLRVSAIGEAQYWHQYVRKQGPRTSWVFGGGAAAGVRAPVYGAFFGELMVGVLMHKRPTLIADLVVGMHF